MENEMSEEEHHSLDCQLANLFLDAIPKEKFFNLYIGIKSKRVIESYEVLIVDYLESHFCNSIH